MSKPFPTVIFAWQAAADSILSGLRRANKKKTDGESNTSATKSKRSKKK